MEKVDVSLKILPDEKIFRESYPYEAILGKTSKEIVKPIIARISEGNGKLIHRNNNGITDLSNCPVYARVKINSVIRFVPLSLDEVVNSYIQNSTSKLEIFIGPLSGYVL